MRKELTDLIRATPFVPFIVPLSSGESDTVNHPELAMLTSAAIDVYDGQRASLLSASRDRRIGSRSG